MRAGLGGITRADERRNRASGPPRSWPGRRHVTEEPRFGGPGTWDPSGAARVKGA
jgi:hypothetical protein